MKHSRLTKKRSLTPALAFLTLTLSISFGMAQEQSERKILPSLMAASACCAGPGGDPFNINTGQGEPIDPRWKVNGSTAYTTDPVTGAWTPTLAPARWIQPVASPTPSTNIPTGDYTYTLQFNMDMFDLRLEGKLAADNSAKVFYLNNLIASCAGPNCFNIPQAPLSFSIKCGQLNPNALKIVVNNQGSYSGLVVNGRLTVKRFWDFDGDYHTNIALYRPSTGQWKLSTGDIQFGGPGDKPTPADYDGDGKINVGVFRPSTGTWYTSTDPATNYGAVRFGQNGDLPVPGDYDSDIKSDIAVFRPSTSTYYFLHSSDNSFHALQWGTNGDVPVIGDYDGDGRTDTAVFRPSSGTFYLLLSSDGSIRGLQWGVSGDKPISADFDGDGKTDIAVYRPSTGGWYYLQSSDNSFRGILFGANGDIPVTGDYDGDGNWDAAVFRPAFGTFYILESATGTLHAVPFGANGDIPIAASYIP